jgi:HD superfamily phosphohydrolase
MKVQRIRDPLHNLIEFSGQDFEQKMWDIIQTPPFQRLRRVKQLGFSDLVYPGATHSRFAHSIGVFHTARRLAEVVKQKGSGRDVHRISIALAAALLHDVGHGPFSHAFEAVGKRLGLRFANHEEMSDILIRRGEIGELLRGLGSGFADDVADMVKGQGTQTIHNAIVSSQFDADRLDYLQRDRLMTGTHHGGIDFEWLIANLEVGQVVSGVDDTAIGKIETFVLGPKAVMAAEAFIAGLFQLYPTVYFHKATRGAERLFTELLVRVIERGRSCEADATGLGKRHPIIRFASAPDDPERLLQLDDTVIWGALPELSGATDPIIREVATRLRERRLFKCLDIRRKIEHDLDPSGSGARDDEISKCCVRVKESLAGRLTEQSEDRLPPILVDQTVRTPYKSGDRAKGVLDRISVRDDAGLIVDLQERSRMVAALRTFEVFRVYVADNAAADEVWRIVAEETGHAEQ